MNKPNNKRKKDSIFRIEKIFIELIQTKEINEISVTDICKRAKLNRSTFYANFIDIYDLADKIKEKLEFEVADLYSNVNEENNYTDYNFLKLICHIKDNQIFYKTYFKLGFDNNFITANDNYSRAAARFNITGNVEYHIEFFKAGFNAIIKKWLYSGCKESPEEIIEIIKSEYRK